MQHREGAIYELLGEGVAYRAERVGQRRLEGRLIRVRGSSG